MTTATNDEGILYNAGHRPYNSNNIKNNNNNNNNNNYDYEENSDNDNVN